MSWLDKFGVKAVNPVIDEVWIIPTRYNDSEQTSLIDPIDPIRMYHVSNSNKEWTCNENEYPHKDRLVALYPDAFWVSANLQHYGNELTGEILERDWNKPVTMGHYEGSIYYYSPEEIEDLRNRWID